MPFRTTLLVVCCLSALVHVSALTVSPAKLEIIADPGQSVRSEIELFNEQEETKTFYASYENFESRGDSGAPYFVGANGGLATWIDTPEEITIAPGERIQVPYTISVPSNAKPGGYFAAIFFGSQPTKGLGGGEVTIGGKVGVLVLLKVSGKVEESAGLSNFQTKDTKRFFSSVPIQFEYSFNNEGGDRVVPKGEIVIRNTLRLETATLLANPREGSVLPGSTRRFDVMWGNEIKGKKSFLDSTLYQIQHFHIGWYTAHAKMSWGESAQTGEASYHFFVLPWQLLLVVLAVLAIFWGSFRLWLIRFKKKILAEMNKHQK